jgi:hypothetical protein
MLPGKKNPKRKARPRTSSSTKTAALPWVGRITIPCLVAGGVRMMPDNYWFGITLVYLGMSGLFLEAYFEKWFLDRPLLRCATLCAIILAISVFSWIYVFFAAPLEVSVSTSDTGYSDGTVVDGIPWRAGLSELRISLRNDTGRDYSNVELLVNADRMIWRTVCVGGCPTCVIGYPSGPIENASLRPVNGPGGKPTGAALPVRKSGSSVFTVRCDRLQHHTQVNLLAATFIPEKPIVLDDKGTVRSEYSVMGATPPREPKKAERVNLRWTYSVRGRAFRKDLRDALK